MNFKVLKAGTNVKIKNSDFIGIIIAVEIRSNVDVQYEVSYVENLVMHQRFFSEFEFEIKDEIEKFTIGFKN